MKRWRVERSSLVVRAIIIVHYSWTKIGSQTSRAHMHACRIFEQEAPPEPIYTYTQERICFPSPHTFPPILKLASSNGRLLLPPCISHHSLAPSIPQPLSDRGRRSVTDSQQPGDGYRSCQSHHRWRWLLLLHRRSSSRSPERARRRHCCHRHHSPPRRQRVG